MMMGMNTGLIRKEDAQNVRQPFDISGDHRRRNKYEASLVRLADLIRDDFSLCLFLSATQVEFEPSCSRSVRSR
jgi:hypothetical protein